MHLINEYNIIPLRLANSNTFLVHFSLVNFYTSIFGRWKASLIATTVVLVVLLVVCPMLCIALDRI